MSAMMPPSDPPLKLLTVIPVVLVSAFPDKAKKLVAKAFVEKPIDLKSLLNVVQQYC
jgi:hypothetical protein